MPGDTTSVQEKQIGQWGTGFTPTHVPMMALNIHPADYSTLLNAIDSAGKNIINFLRPDTISKIHNDVLSTRAGAELWKWAADPQNMWYLKSVAGAQGAGITLHPGGQFGEAFRTLLGGPQTQPASSNAPTNTHGETPDNQSTTTNNPPAPQNTDNTDNTSTTDQIPRSLHGGGPVRRYQEGGPVNAPPAPGALPGHIPYSPESQANAMSMQGGNPLAPESQLAMERAAEQQRLIQWQNQNQGGVMSAVEARNWARDNLDTDITRAVYLPSGGPPGPNGQKEAAYAFMGKKGGTNVVPVSQIVKAGGGPLVAAQNSSHVLNSAQQQNQPQPGPGQQGAQPPGAQPTPSPSATPMPQGTPQPVSTQQPPEAPSGGATAGVPPPAAMTAAGPPGAPGAAPGSQVPQLPGGGTDWGAIPGQLPQDEMNRRIAAATFVQNAGGPNLNQLLAQTGPSNPSSKSQQITGYVTNETGMTQDRLDQMKAHPMPVNPNSPRSDQGDPQIGQWGNFKWYRSDKGGGPAYTEIPGEGGFWRYRMFENSNEWYKYLPPENYMAQQLLDARPDLYNAIKGIGQPKMSPLEMQSELMENYYLKNGVSRLQRPVPPADAARLDEQRKTILNLIRLHHAVYGPNGDGKDEHGNPINPADFSQENIDQNNLILKAKREWRAPPRGTTDLLNDIDALNIRRQVGPWIGELQPNNRVTFVEQQLKEALTHLTPEERAAGGLDVIGGITKGDPAANQRLWGRIMQLRQGWQNEMTNLIQGRFNVPAQSVAMYKGLMSGKPWYDGNDEYGPNKDKKYIVPALEAEANRQNTTPTTAGTGPHPTPTPLSFQNRRHP